MAENKMGADFFDKITSIFTDIDDKILSLYECSSDDFKLFNDRLKQYHSVVNVINENSQKILESIDSEKTSDFFTRLNFLHYRIKTFVNTYEKTIDEKIVLLESLLKQINLLYLPLKNYKQNLITLKYLIANFKINMAYEAIDMAIKIDSQITEIDDAIKELVKEFPKFEAGIEELKSEIYYAIMSFRNFKDNSTINSSMILHQTDYSLNLLNVKHTGIVSQTNQLRKKTKISSDNVSKIIVNLQFHDIIRQKIEHIQSANKTIIKEIQSFKSLNTDEEIHKNTKRIKDLAELQIAQLTHSNRKYQSAIDSITTQFAEIATHLYSVVSHSEGNKETRLDVKNVEIAFSDIENELLNGYKIVENLNNAIDDFYQKSESINLATNKLEEKNSDIFERKTKLTNLLKVFFEKNNTGQTEHFYSLLLDYINKDENFENYFNSIQETFKNLKKQIKEVSSFQSEKDFLPKFRTKISSTGEEVNILVESLVAVNKEVAGRIVESQKLSNEIVSDIKKSLKYVKYYDYFEKVMEHEVIIKLNNLYDELTHKVIENVKDVDKSDYLDKINELYTMHSERVIHTNFEGKTNLDVNVEDKNVANFDDEDDDVEFF